jgi:hypothetical protein
METWMIASPRNYIPSQPVRNRSYLAFVRTFPCAGCGSRRRVEAAHTGPHGLSQKASDLDTIPLCRFRCHPAFDANPEAFAQLHRLDIPFLIRKLNRFFFRGFINKASGGTLNTSEAKR